MGITDTLPSLIVIDLMIAAVTVAWLTEFLAPIFIPNYPAHPEINGLFTSLLGAGVLGRGAVKKNTERQANGDPP